MIILDTASRLLEAAVRVIEEDKDIRHVKTRHLHVLVQPQLEGLHIHCGDTHMALELVLERCRVG